MSDNDARAILRKAMDNIAAGRDPEGASAHIDRAPTKADWDALDLNSYETTCAKCDAHIIGQFGPGHELSTPCPECGSLETKGGMSSPAGGTHLMLWSDF